MLRRCQLHIQPILSDSLKMASSEAKLCSCCFLIDYPIYKDECLFVCMELIQIHISGPIGTKLCSRLPLGLEEVVGCVWTHNISTFPLFGVFCRERVPICARKIAAGTTLPRYCVVSRVGVTSRTPSHN